MSRPNFKLKYHGDPLRSNEKKRLEDIVYGYLSNALGPYFSVLMSGIHGVGVVEGHNAAAERADFTVVSVFTKRVLAYLELTGDREPDEYARVLEEKVRKLLGLRDAPSFIIYYKLPKRKRSYLDVPQRYCVVYTLGTILRKRVRKGKWLPDEGDYYFVKVADADWKGLPAFASAFRNHIAPCIFYNSYNWRKCLRW